MHGYHLTPQQRDKRAAERALADLENKTYKDTILALESHIEEKDKEIKELTSKIHNPTLYSAPQLRAFRIHRKKLKKSREKLVIKLDLLRK